MQEIHLYNLNFKRNLTEFAKFDNYQILQYNSFNMSFTLNKIFTTATANPTSDSIVREAAPCDALKPYIRCFWETTNCDTYSELRIIPDCCCDIIFFASNDKIYCNFCGVNNRSFLATNNAKMFGIRFYAWSVYLFTSEKIQDTLNKHLPAQELFDNCDRLATDIFTSTLFATRISVAQKYLIGRLNTAKENFNVLNSLYKIIKQCANINVEALSDYCAVSKRTLERDFRICTGLSPKEAIELIRYQLLWQDCLKPDFSILDSVEKFGFYDSSHLYRYFKKYHGISLPKAVQ